jgi:hypothetical protein
MADTEHGEDREETDVTYHVHFHPAREVEGHHQEAEAGEGGPRRQRVLQDAHRIAREQKSHGRARNDRGKDHDPGDRDHDREDDDDHERDQLRRSPESVQVCSSISATPSGMADNQ